MFNFIGRKKDNIRIIQFEYSLHRHDLSNFSKQFVFFVQFCTIILYIFCGQFRMVFFKILADDI